MTSQSPFICIRMTCSSPEQHLVACNCRATVENLPPLPPPPPLHNHVAHPTQLLLLRSTLENKGLRGTEAPCCRCEQFLLLAEIEHARKTKTVLIHFIRLETNYYPITIKLATVTKHRS